jgi:hypothetical protein
MTDSKMMIPDTIRVGYQTRSDTYTGKLAYVIYIDEKGKVRKESSWKSWRDAKIEPNDFKNEPTSGFVLNKKVGDYKSDWNHRMAHIRIYDPRGFEFEISVENLLYILQECTSTKGKGLEGDFVYAWSGSDLVLLPTTSQEYVSSREFTDMKTCKVGKKDMKEGCVYVTKDMREVMYLGKHEIFKSSEERINGSYSHTLRGQISEGKKQVFALMNVKEEERSWGEPEKYLFLDGFTKLGTKVSDQVASNYPEVFEEFKQSLYGTKISKIIVTSKLMDEEMFKSKDNSYYWGTNYTIKVDDKTFKMYSVSKVRKQINNQWVDMDDLFEVKESNTITINNENTTATFMRSSIEYGSYYTNYSDPWRSRPLVKPEEKTLAELLSMETFSIRFENEYGKIIKLF